MIKAMEGRAHERERDGEQVSMMAKIFFFWPKLAICKIFPGKPLYFHVFNVFHARNIYEILYNSDEQISEKNYNNQTTTIYICGIMANLDNLW